MSPPDEKGRPVGRRLHVDPRQFDAANSIPEREADECHLEDSANCVLAGTMTLVSADERAAFGRLAATRWARTSPYALRLTASGLVERGLRTPGAAA